MTNELTANTKMTETSEVVVVDGKYKRMAVYEPYTSVIPETREQKVKLFRLLEDGEDVTSMKDATNQVIDIQDVVVRPYDTVDEETGEISQGVTVVIIDQDGKAFATSSKSVYFKLKSIFGTFGYPHYEADESVKVKVVKKRATNEYIDLELVG